MATRIHIVLPDDVLAERDQLVGKRKRSQFIEEAVRDKLRMERQHKAIREGAGILKDYDYPEWETPEKISAWVREQRTMDARPIRKVSIRTRENV